MNMQKQPGWLYVGDGWLRYRDSEGWTDHFLPAESIRGFDWPPEAPAVWSDDLLQREVDESAPTVDAPAPLGPSRVRGLLGPGRRHTGRHRAQA